MTDGPVLTAARYLGSQMLGPGRHHDLQEAEQDAAEDDDDRPTQAGGGHGGCQQRRHEQAVMAGKPDIFERGKAREQDVKHKAEHHD